MRLLFATVFMCLVVVGCNESSKPTNEEENSLPSLQEKLNAKKQQFQEKASKEKIELYKNGIEQVRETGIEKKAIQVGDRAIDFTLPNHTGKDISLNALLKEGTVILTWYRGGWCPYCNIALSSMQQALPEFKKYNATLVAISPEKPDKSMSTVEKNELQFQILSDTDNQVARSYNIVFKLPEKIAQIYEENLKLSEFNGNKKGELPMAATYVIDKMGKIRYAFLDADYTKRAEPSEIIEVLKKMQE